MSSTFNFRDPLTINTVGHSVGLLLFAVVVALLIADWRRNGIRQTGLTLIAASLALLWNLGSLFVLASFKGPGLTLDALVTFSFAVLSVLPAVLLNIVFQRKRRAIVISGYVLGIVAVLLHVWEVILAQPRLHQWALIVIAAGYAAVLGVAILFMVKSERTTAGFRSRLVSLVCLLLFSLSFLHFGIGHPAAAWTTEIAWHQASIPLVLVVLLQDYRFLFLDVFLQFLVNFGLAVAFVASAFFAMDQFDLWTALSRNEFWSGVGVVSLCLYLIVFAYARRALQMGLSAALFRRTSFETCARDLAKALDAAQDEKAMLRLASAELAKYLGARQTAVENALQPHNRQPFLTGPSTRGNFTEPPAWAQVALPVCLFQGDCYFLLFGSRAGGRRYVSQDLDVLQRFAAIIVEQVERFRHRSLERLVTQAELRALQSQINPHFLFNALNTLYGTIDRTSQQARQLVLNLAELFRYVLNTDRQFIQLEEELRIVRAYLDIEKLRLGDRLEVQWAVSESSKAVSIPVLSIQPIVENAVKHGISAKRERGIVRVAVESLPDRLWIRVEDTGQGFGESESAGRGSGVGLDNVRQRLMLCYGKMADLTIESSKDGSVVSFFVPVEHTLLNLATEVPEAAAISEAQQS
ncbi:MAG TPA: histidine kinase [Bryobacteraceae bacterium]|nr:histidine kinase [Bryobacteraceae bacterium]